MARLMFPRNLAPAVHALPREHPNVIRVANQIIDHARAGRAALVANRVSEAKYHCSCCGLLLWRLSVDGLTKDGQLRFDAAKYETRLPGRLSTMAARAIRDSSDLSWRAQSALENKVACDHIVPRNCVGEVLISPEWLDLEDAALAQAFILSHAEVAILSPEENEALNQRGLQSEMPQVWWDAPISGKFTHRFARYEAMGITVTPWTPRALAGPGSRSGTLVEPGSGIEGPRDAEQLPEAASPSALRPDW